MSDFNRDTLSQLIDRARSDINGRITGADSYLRRAVLNSLAVVWAGMVNGLYGYLETLANEFMPQTAKLWVLRHASIWNLSQIAATIATGSVTISGTVGKTVPANTTLQRSDGVLFRTKTALTLTGATGSVAVVASAAGTGGNTPAGATLSFISPIAGISSSAVSGGISGGKDIESQASLQARTLERIAETPQGGSDADYKRWTKEITGQTRVWVYKNWTGAGRVGVAFVMDGRDDIIPTDDEVEAVQDYLDEVAPVTATVIVFAPIADVFAPSITVTPATDAVKAAVLAQLTDYLTTEAQPGGTEPLSRINEAISLAEGETDHVLVSPVANVTHTAGHIAVMGDITWVP